MKSNIVYITLILLLTCMVNPLLAGWNWVNPQPQGNSLSFISSSPSGEKIITGGRASTLMLSTDYAATWQQVIIDANGQNDIILDGEFTDSNTAFLICYSGKIFKSTDGAQNWNMIKEFPNSYIFAIDMISSEVGFVLVVNSMYQFRVYKTTNSGMTWSSINIPPALYNYAFYDMDFCDENTGILVGVPGIVISTQNGGQNWNVRHQDTDHQYWTAKCINSQKWWVAGDDLTTEGYGVLLSTNNGGGQWQSTSLDEFQYPKKIQFFGETKGFLLCDLGIIYTSQDSGISWERHDLQKSGVIGDVCSLQQDTFVLCGMGGMLFHYNFQNHALTELSENADGASITNVNFNSNGIGLCTTDNGKILRSIDGGENWSMVTGLPQTTMGYLGQISWPEPQIVFVSGTDYSSGARIFWKSMDAGLSWSEVSTNEEYMDAIHFLDGDNGFGCFGTYIKRTYDGGVSWQECYHDSDPIAYAITSIHFWDDLHGIAGGMGAKVYITNDGGYSWCKHNLPINGYMAESIDRVQWISQDVLIAGYGSILYKSVDSGVSWEVIHETTEYSFKDFYFTDSVHGFAAISTEVDEINIGRVAKTINGGVTWETIDCISDNHFHSVYMGSNNILWIAGDCMNLLKYTDSTHTEDPVFIPTPASFLAYPNPFRSHVTFSFESGCAKPDAEMYIYNLKGQKVGKATTEEKNGSIVFTWDGKDANHKTCASGIYFAKYVGKPNQQVIKILKTN